MKTFDDVDYRKSFPELKLEQALSTVIKLPPKPLNPTLSPSMLTCQRAAAFKLSGQVSAAGEETYESTLPAAVGSFIHSHIQKFLSESDIWVDVKDFIKENPQLGLEVSPTQKHDGEVSLIFNGIRNLCTISPPFSFQCDGIVKIDNKYYIVEIKTESETAWQNRGAPNPKYSMQARAYAFLYGISDILWIYASRESFGTHRKIYLETVSESKISEFKGMCDNIDIAVQGDSIKDLPKGKDCRYCSFVELCKSLGK